jgi:hypothetical protein
MNGWEVLTKVVSVVSVFPFERFLVRDHDKDLLDLEIKLKDKGILQDQAKARGSSIVSSSTPPTSELSPSLTRLQEAQEISRVTPEETLAYQNKKIVQVLYGLELHLAESCRIFGKPCDCCDKHSLIEGLAQETIPIASRMGKSTQPYELLVSWIDRNRHKFSEEAVASGKYDTEYKALSGEVSLLRKGINAVTPSRTGELLRRLTPEKPGFKEAEL